MDSDGVTKDLRSFVAAQLDNDKRLRKWKDYRSKIENALVTRAKGGYVPSFLQCINFSSVPSSIQTQLHLLF